VAVIGGSEGWVEYEVPIGRDKETFRLIFECPQSPGSKNRLEAANYNKNVLDITVEPYDKGGHPLYGTYLPPAFSLLLLITLCR
jgi:hypothetical protein